jgi:hypothetical protein
MKSESTQRGFSLSSLFVLITACAALVAGFTPLVRRAFQGDIDGLALSLALVSGFLVGGLIGGIVGLLQIRSWLAAPLGAVAGALVGVASGLIALMPPDTLGAAAVAMLIGSALVVAIALLHRRING